MRDLLNPTIAELQAFLDHSDKLALILRSPVSDALPILKVLEGLDDPNPSDLFWSYTDTFHDAKTYAKQVIANFTSKHQMVQLLMKEEGMHPWKDIPIEILSEEHDPVTRIRSLTVFSRELLPTPLGGNNVWIFFPLQIDNYFEYSIFFQNLLKHEFPNPWCHHLRFVVREDPSDSRLSRGLATNTSVGIHEPDLSSKAVEKSLEREIANESQPLETRLSSLLVLAGMDVAHSRFSESLEKYALVLRYFAPMGNHTMAAVALNGMGEVYVRLGNKESANTAFQSALIPASYGEHPPHQVFLNIALNLANLRMAQENWEQAAGYWDVVQKQSILTRDAGTRIRAMEQLGYCRYRLREFEAAEKSWHDGAAMAGAIYDKDLQRSLLERRKNLYAEKREFQKEREINNQLADLI